MSWATPSRGTYLTIGLAVGLVLGLVLSGWWPTTPLHATASMGADNFVIATGPIDDGVEAIYFLDFLTGDLRAAVLNQRSPGFSAFFEYNITKDFNVGGGANPKYLMVTGVANIPRGQGNTQLAQSAVYVTEANTGQLVAYMLPWNSSLYRAGKALPRGTFYKVDSIQLRTAFVRDQ
jgi:hypothetical protein